MICDHEVDTISIEFPIGSKTFAYHAYCKKCGEVGPARKQRCHAETAFNRGLRDFCYKKVFKFTLGKEKS